MEETIDEWRFRDVGRRSADPEPDDAARRGARRLASRHARREAKTLPIVDELRKLSHARARAR